MNFMKLISPLTHSENISLEKEIKVDDIIKLYHNSFQIDVKRFFEGISTINIYRCNDSGFRFFYPYTISGDDEFYTELQKFDWYYMPWKWEHEQACNWLKDGMRVLEVGCGDGSFLERIKNHYKIEATGIEFNTMAVKKALEKKLDVRQENLLTYSQNYNNYYDLVCSFQVFEHIADVRSFLMAQINCLKQGGKLIISVPNNDSFLRLDNANSLNMPPHHMGLWNKKSLTNLENVFNIKLENIIIEPLQFYHHNYFINVMKDRNIQKYGYAGKIYNRLRHPLLKFFVSKFSKYIKGHTILAEYSKLVEAGK